jgi:4-carboxymuconolactone decarboxylase
MTNDERRARGEEMFHEVYGGIVPLPPVNDDFLRLLLDQLFAEVWSREALSIRDRRLILVGVLAALGEGETFEIQIRAALTRGELTREQVEEVLIFLPSYVGYPRASRLRAIVQRIFAETKGKAPLP